MNKISLNHVCWAHNIMTKRVLKRMMTTTESLHSHVFHLIHLQNFLEHHKNHDEYRQNDGVHIYFRPNSFLMFRKMAAKTNKNIFVKEKVQFYAEN